MLRRLLTGVVLTCALGTAGHVTPDTLLAQTGSTGCAQLTALKLPDVRITEAAAVPPAASGPVRAAHCRVTGVIGTEIRFALLLPDAWNGKFLMGGGGGYVGSVQNQAQASVDAGYATAGTDTGHQGFLTDASWALEHPERQVNFGYLAVHRTAEVAKALIRSHYGTEASRSYFAGCSNGGRQGLMSAQRFPGDFDGIVAAAPAYDFVGLASQFIKDAQVLYSDAPPAAPPLLPPDTMKAVETEILEKCDAVDSITDGLIDDPRRCDVDVNGLSGLTGPQRAALARLYAETTGSSGTVYFGQPVGGEGDGFGWPMWITGGGAQSTPQGPSFRFAFGTQFFKYFVFNDPDWDYTRYDISRARQDARVAGAVLSATSTDLAAFKARGGKLIMWHGWSDPALTALASIDYFEKVEAHDPGVREYFRLFLAPGVLHCTGGPGPVPASTTWWTAIADWVEHGRAPERITATKTVEGTIRTRPLCPYPQRAVYSGSGSIDDERNFVCR